VSKRGHDPSFFPSPSQTNNNTSKKICLFERGIKRVSLFSQYIQRCYNI
jgi:hypothetical protein